MGWLPAALLVACGSHAPPAAAPAEEKIHAEDDADAGPEVVTLPPPPERALPPSTASYDEALATPESLDVNDDRAHLTDGQLTGPMRGVLEGCRVPSTAHVTIKTAVLRGRAIGVTVLVAWDHPKSVKHVSASRAKYESKVSAKIVTCADQHVRQVVWPPSSRRDSFTTTF